MVRWSSIVQDDADKNQNTFNINYLSRLIAIPVVASVIFFNRAALADADGWDNNWNFKRSGGKSVVLLQADLIKKAESDYYDNVGKITYTNYDYSNTTNNNTDNSISNDNRTGAFNDVYSVGAINASTNTITIDGSDNDVMIDSNSEARESINSSISITERVLSGLDNSESTNDEAAAEEGTSDTQQDMDTSATSVIDNIFPAILIEENAENQ